jgi:hypothetical protein
MMMKPRINAEGGKAMPGGWPTIHVSEERTSPVETTGWDDLGLVEEWMTGYHAGLAWQVTALPIYDGMAMVRGLRWDEWARRTLMEQMRFLAAWQPELDPLEGTFNPTLRSLQLRFLGGREASRLGIWLLAKVFDPDPDRVRMRARALHEEVQALFPPGYGLQPLTEAADLARCWPLATDEGEEDGWWLAEIRRGISRVGRRGVSSTAPRRPSRSQKLFADRQIRRQTAGPSLRSGWKFGNPTRANCDLPSPPEDGWKIYPFVWSVGGLRHTLEVIQAMSGRAMLCVTLRPTGLHEMEEERLELLRPDLQSGRESLPTGRRKQRAGVPCRWRHPYLLRVCLAGHGTCPDPLVRALAADLTAPDGSTRPYTVTYPEGPEEREVARRNLRWLEMEGWGTEVPLAPPDRRLHHLVDVREAQAAFRVPMLDPDEAEGWGLRVD